MKSRILTSGKSCPSITPLRLPLLVIRSPQAHTPNSISISSSFFAGLMLVANTDRPCCMCNNRPHLLLCIVMQGSLIIIVVVVVIIILWHSRDAYVSQSSDFSTVKVFYICKFIKLLLRLAAFYVVGCSTSILIEDLMFYQLFTVHTKCCRFCVTL